MEYYNGILCIEGGWLYGEGNIMSKPNYSSLIRRNIMTRVRKSAPGMPALIAYDTIPHRFRNLITEKVGDPHVKTKHVQFRQNITPDTKAYKFFHETYLLEDGRRLKGEAATEYTLNAMLLNAIRTTVITRKSKRRALGGITKGIWEQMAETMRDIRDEYNHSLPLNARRLKQKYNDYINTGYMALIHRGYGNMNSRKVNDIIESLVLSIYSMRNRHFRKTVHELYLMFLAGNIEVVDINTGEIFKRDDFTDTDGNFIQISETTIRNVLNNPRNELEVSKWRDSAINFKTQKMPYNHRHRPEYSLSKISMDDRDLPHKSKDGIWATAYYAFDVHSEAIIGWSHSIKKDMALVYDTFRHMYRNLTEHNLPWPAECEVENHLMSQIREELFEMFPYVRFCNPQNSREKRAEHLIRLKKYEDEKMHQENVGRWYASSKAYGVNQDIKSKLTTDELIADDIESIMRFNNHAHSRYKNKTRWQVLTENLNSELTTPNKRIIAKNIGGHTVTSIRNNDFVQVMYEHYALDNIDIVLKRLKPNNYTIDAYYMPHPDGTIQDVYLYQDNEYLCAAHKIESYNEAQAERTEHDEEIRTNQAKRQAKMRKKLKDDTRIHNVDIVFNTDTDPYDVPCAPVVTEEQNEIDEMEKIIEAIGDEAFMQAKTEFDNHRALDTL